MSDRDPLRISVLAAVPPLTAGAAHFNAALVTALRSHSTVDVISWHRHYPPVVYRGRERDDDQVPAAEESDFLLDWADPRSWRRALSRVHRFRADAMVLPWLHPVMAPPYRWLLRHAPKNVSRVVICHNVVPHESTPLAGMLTRLTLRHADVLVTHAPQQRAELEALGLGRKQIAETFHPRFQVDALAPVCSTEDARGERQVHGDPRVLLLCFGAVRAYKGIDLAIAALAQVNPALDVKLVVAGRFWNGGRVELERQAAQLGIADRVELHDRYVSNAEMARLFGACDATLLSYRSATQSGVAQLSFAYGRPVIATSVGGLPAAVRDGVDGLISRPEPTALARAIERFAHDRERLRAGVVDRSGATSFDAYAELLENQIRVRSPRGRRALPSATLVTTGPS